MTVDQGFDNVIMKIDLKMLKGIYPCSEERTTTTKKTKIKKKTL